MTSRQWNANGERACSTKFGHDGSATLVPCSPGFSTGNSSPKRFPRVFRQPGAAAEQSRQDAGRLMWRGRFTGNRDSWDIACHCWVVSVAK